MSEPPVYAAGRALVEEVRNFGPPVSSYYTVVLKTRFIVALESALEAGPEGKCSECGFAHLACQSLWCEQKKCCPDCTHRERIPAPDWAKLLLECRDALPAITLSVARLHNLDLTLADRIEEILKPWRTGTGDREGR